MHPVSVAFYVSFLNWGMSTVARVMRAKKHTHIVAMHLKTYTDLGHTKCFVRDATKFKPVILRGQIY